MGLDLGLGLGLDQGLDLGLRVSIQEVQVENVEIAEPSVSTYIDKEFGKSSVLNQDA